jgi:hypothetical protein
MNPAKGMKQYVQLTRMIADNHHIRVETMLNQTSDQPPFDRNPDMTFGLDSVCI